MSGDNLNNQIIESKDSPIENVESDEVTQVSPMEANQQQNMVSDERAKAEADIINEKDPTEDAKLNIIDSLDKLDTAEPVQPSEIESFLQEDVST